MGTSEAPAPAGTAGTLAHVVDRVAAVREALGPERDLAMNFHAG
jgi:L-alanine-DL-glutamate epimerase-like enolase superfamily enzyme